MSGTITHTLPSRSRTLGIGGETERILHFDILVHMKDVPSSESEIKDALTPGEYRVLREKGTEAPFSGALLHEKRSGTFNCKVCGNPLFSSDAKFESGTGWPSFDKALPGAVKFREDMSHGMRRTEVICARCSSHLGHIFDDGPAETTGKRHCINSVCLEFEEK